MQFDLDHNESSASLIRSTNILIENIPAIQLLYTITSITKSPRRWTAFQAGELRVYMQKEVTNLDAYLFFSKCFITDDTQT